MVWVMFSPHSPPSCHLYFSQYPKGGGSFKATSSLSIPAAQWVGSVRNVTGPGQQQLLWVARYSSQASAQTVGKTADTGGEEGKRDILMSIDREEEMILASYRDFNKNLQWLPLSGLVWKGSAAMPLHPLLYYLKMMNFYNGEKTSIWSLPLTPLKCSDKFCNKLSKNTFPFFYLCIYIYI